MSRIDPECFSQPGAYRDARVCMACLEDDDLAEIIEDQDGPPGCSFCGGDDAPTVPFEDLAEHIHERLREFYGKAADQLPYESAEGGYQGWTASTRELLEESVELGLPRDTDGGLIDALVHQIGDDCWCEYDWLTLNPDDSLASSWEAFCETVKYERRFFFHNLGEDDGHGPDERSPAQFFRELGRHIDDRGLIVTEAVGYTLYRARVRHAGEEHTTPSALGPPPPDVATQSNRMNPPGISMFYGADNAELATAETRGQAVSVGRFETTRPARILDLADLAPAPGFFSTAERGHYYVLRFLHAFADMIIEPVPRNDRTQIDYIPTQVFTEFLRDYPFEDGHIDGIRYRSATGEAGVNVVLFANPLNIVDGVADPQFAIPQERWLRLAAVEQRDAP